VTGTTPGARGGDDIGYAEALAELEGILDELDGDEVDVDVLGARVRRASELLRLCRERIAGARFEVEQVVAELEAEADAATAASPGPGADDDEGDDEGDEDGDEDEDEGYRGEGG
jgi:exodeoxyribonuclease VII small subunit